MGWLGLFVGDDFSLSDVGDSSCVCASLLCGYGEIFNEAFENAVADDSFVIEKTKYCTQITIPPQ